MLPCCSRFQLSFENEYLTVKLADRRNFKRVYERLKAFIIETTLVGSTQTLKSTGTIDLISNIEIIFYIEILEMNNVLHAACLTGDLYQTVIPQGLSENDLQELYQI